MRWLVLAIAGIALAGGRDARAQPAPGRIVEVEVVGSRTRIVIDRGSKHGVAVGWRGHLSKDGQPMPRGDFRVDHVVRESCDGSVDLSPDQLGRDVAVQLEPPPDPLKARIIDVVAMRPGSVITIDVGSEDGVAKGWIGHVVDDDGLPLDHGAFTIARVDKGTAVARVALTPRALRHHDDVKVEAP